MKLLGDDVGEVQIVMDEKQNLPANAQLLQPSLSDSATPAMFSTGAMLACAFFGGSLAVVLMVAENARRQQTLARDLGWILAGLVISVLFLLAMIIAQPSLFGFAILDRDIRLIDRGLGFLLAGLHHLLKRQRYRAQRTLGLDPASPYTPALIVCAVAMSTSYFLMSVTTSIPVPELFVRPNSWIP